MKSESGIYLMTLSDGKRYIGSSVDIGRRIKEHYSRFSNKTHHNKYILALASRGRTIESIDKLASCPPEYLEKLELFAIKALAPELNMSSDTAATGGSNRKTVYQYCQTSGRLLGTFASTREAARKLDLEHTNISSCCLGKAKSCGGYLWSYQLLTKIPSYSFRKSIQAVTSDGRLLVFDSLRDCARKLNLDSGNISNAIKREGTVQGYRFYYLT